MKLQVTARRALTSEIEEFTLSSLDKTVLLIAEPGAHISITTPSGARRRYSLVHPGNDLNSYTVAIKLEQASRGGSKSMHELASIGTILDVDTPDNEFPLGDKHPALLIAGGIGITPIFSMAQKLSAEGRDFRVIYCSREENLAAYVNEMKELCGEKLTLHFSQELGNTQFDFWDLLMSPTKEHVYCCGPNGLMEEIKGVTGHWPEGHIHFEEFQPVDVIRDDDKSFTVVLNKSGDEIKIPSDRTILEGLRDSGYNFPSSCENGSCGTCKCQVIDGEVDHRDIVLMNDEKDSTIMLCVSRAKGERLVLDL